MSSTPRRLSLLTASLCLAAGCGPDPSSDGVAAEAPGAPQLQLTPDGRVAAGQGYRVVGGDTVILPDSMRPPRGLALGQNGRHVLFLNTEGTDVRGGTSNALENSGIRDRSKDDAGVIEVEAYAPATTKRGEDILKIQKLVAGWYADYNVDVVISRPLSGDYMMTVVGGGKGDLGFGGGVAGISPGDCRNNNEVDLNYVFSASLGQEVTQTAVTAAHEAGHAYGLGHTLNKRDIMYPSVQTDLDGFAGGEVADPGPCNAMQGDVQDSHQVLLDNLGSRDPASPRPGSGSGPSVSFLSPPESAVGSDVTIAVKADARLGVDRVTLAASAYSGDKPRGGHPLAELRPPASSAKVRFSAAGDYELIATAYDRAGNVAQSRTRIKVAAPTCNAANDCAPGQKCSANVCTTPPLPEGDKTALRPWGTACNKSSECQGGICALTPVGQICTHYCNADRLCASASLECVDGICLPPIVQRATPKPGQLGGKCTRNQDCFTGECSAASMDDPTAPRYCTQVCEPEVAWSCPAQMSCVMTDGASGQKNRCVVGAPKAAAGGCSAAPAAPGPRSGAAALALLLGSLLLRRRRAS